MTRPCLVELPPCPHDARELPGSDLSDQRSEERVGWLPPGPQEQVRELLPDRTLKPTPGGEPKAAEKGSRKSIPEKRASVKTLK